MAIYRRTDIDSDLAVRFQFAPDLLTAKYAESASQGERAYLEAVSAYIKFGSLKFPG